MCCLAVLRGHGLILIPEILVFLYNHKLQQIKGRETENTVIFHKLSQHPCNQGLWLPHAHPLANDAERKVLLNLFLWLVKNLVLIQNFMSLFIKAPRSFNTFPEQSILILESQLLGHGYLGATVSL